MKKSRHLLAIILFLTLGSALLTKANVSEAAMLFLEIPSSPIAVGMGECGINLVNEESALSNPGAFGLFYLDHLGAIAVPNSNAWLPALYDDMSLGSFSVSGQVMSPDKAAGSDGPVHTLGVAFSRHKLDYGYIPHTNDAHETAYILTFGYGLDNGYQIGIGYSFKYINSHLAEGGAGAEQGRGTTTATAHDFGLMARYPYLSQLGSTELLGNVAIGITPSLAAVASNLGPDVTYPDKPQTDPLPTVAKIGFSLLLDFRINHASALSFRGTHEKAYNLNRKMWDRENYGLEIGLLGAFYGRAGISQLDSRETVLCRGFSFRPRGLMDIILNEDRIKVGSSVIDYLFEHFDIAFDFARMDTEADGGAVDDTKLIRFRLSL